MHCCITMRQAENNIFSIKDPGRYDLLKTNRREIQGGHVKLRENLFP